MFPPHSCLLALAILLSCRFAFAQTVVNSTFVDTYPGSSYWAYEDPSHWNPGEVPNNTPTKQFNVTIATFYEVEAASDVTISNLTLAGTASGFGVFNKTFTVTGTTTIQSQGQGLIEVSGVPATPAKFDAGTLSSFSDHTLRGNYYRLMGTLQFRGADIWAFRDGALELHPGSAIIDEFGNGALRNFALLDSAAVLYLYGQNVVTNAAFLNEGVLVLTWLNAPSTFTALSGLRNFEGSPKTLRGGRFELTGGTVRFDAADIVNLASTVSLGTDLGIADLAGNDGLRNLAHILPDGVLNIGRDFTTAGSFTNDGSLQLNKSTFTITGALNNFDASSHTLTGGIYDLAGSTDYYGSPGSTLKFSGADIVHNQASISLSAGKIMDLAGNDGLRNFNDNGAHGSFTVSPAQLFVAPGNFTNAGTVTLNPLSPAHDNRTVAAFQVPAGSSYTQTAGTTVNAGTITADINVLGGSFLNRSLSYYGGLPATGRVQGHVNVSNAVFVPKGSMSGNLTLGANARFHSTIGWVADSILVQGSTTLGGTLEVELTGYSFPKNSDVITILQSQGAMSGTFVNAADGARIKTSDGAGSFVVDYESNTVKLREFELSPSPATLLNISTRADLLRADEDPSGDQSVLIAGFIISGTESKKVVLRGIGPSLAKAGVSHPLPDPLLELHASDGSVILTNNDWHGAQEAEITASGLAPQDERESALVATLAPGTYTVVIRDVTGLSGTGLVEVYDISGGDKSKLANISTRGFTDATNPLIGGIIAGGPGDANVELVVRARGPRLRRAGVADALNNVVLEFRDANGSPVGSQQQVIGTPRDVPLGFGVEGGESAIRVSVPRGNYTALVWPTADDRGVALVEFYDVRQ